ncbi:MAG TPA: glycogen debranching protein [Cytophagales bacterium]|nr:glycogen debranching protein [Cytophagales bacterium]
MKSFFKCYFVIYTALFSCQEENRFKIDHHQLAKEYYNEDAEWYVKNIPFFECSDKIIQDVYYYRWELFKAHIRNVGVNEYVITEFIDHVPWDREPYCTINAASMHHIYEGRWLKDQCYMDGYINYLFYKGGNDRRYSESIADATYARHLVNGDKKFIVDQLDSMIAIQNRWADHYDSAKNLYYIPAMPDATEYNIAAVDASGGKGGFEGGEAFRPTINSYMFSNALAISKIAALAGREKTSKQYQAQADQLKNNIQNYLWNDDLVHFTDRYKVNNQFVKYWEFIRGRELAGFAPWYFNLPDDQPKYHQAWKHLKDTSQLLGKFGFRTNEPSYQYYFKQLAWFNGKRSSQWNGPSWPYQTSQALTGMANFIQHYDQSILTPSDYVNSLRLFARQHLLPAGTINLVENYDPNFGGPIVHEYWSDHYLHSTFNNLVISGLCGIQPSEGDSLDINQIIDSSIKYYCLSGLSYHGHDITVLYDDSGEKYKIGKGVKVFVDGEEVRLTQRRNSFRVYVGKQVRSITTTNPVNQALNISKHRFPKISASVNTDSTYQLNDGRIWYFTEIKNQWSTWNSTNTDDWVTIEFDGPRNISEIKLYPVVNRKFMLPQGIKFESKMNNDWKSISAQESPTALKPNSVNRWHLPNTSTTSIRIRFTHTDPVAFTEIECF